METKDAAKPYLKEASKYLPISVPKTYKMYIGGKYVRSESGHCIPYETLEGIYRVPMASKKDIKEAVICAAKGIDKWMECPPSLKAQILYRMAEMFDDKKDFFIREIEKIGTSPEIAKKEVHTVLNIIFHYAGWADKFWHLTTCVNPVLSSYFSFSITEPWGIVAIIPPGNLNEEGGSLLIPVSMIMPAIVAGNAVLITVPEKNPFALLSFAEVIANSDIPEGVINIISGKLQRILPTLATHMRIRGVFVSAEDHQIVKYIKENAFLNIKRILSLPLNIITDYENNSLKIIRELQEVKTMWHPIEWIPSLGETRY